MSAEQTPDIERVLAETLTLAVMHYYGFTDEDIAAAEKVHPGRVCDEDECFDEDGTSVHGQAWVELGATANTVIEAVLPALAPVLTAAVRDAEQRAWDEGWQAAGDAYVRGMDAYANGEAMPVSDGPPNPYRADRVAEPQHEAATSGDTCLRGESCGWILCKVHSPTEAATSGKESEDQ